MNKISKETIAEAKRLIEAIEKIPADANFYSNRQRAQAKRESLALSNKLVEFRQTSANAWLRS